MHYPQASVPKGQSAILLLCGFLVQGPFDFVRHLYIGAESQHSGPRFGKQWADIQRPHGVYLEEEAQGCGICRNS